MSRTAKRIERTLVAKLFEVWETVTIPHPYDRKETRSKMGGYQADEFRRLVNEYEDHDYRLTGWEPDDADGNSGYVTMTQGPITVQFELRPYDPMHGG